MADPVPTTEDIEAAIARDLEEGVSSAAGAGESATAMNPVTRLEALAKLKSQQAAARVRNPWGAIARTRVMPPGAT